MNHIYKVPIIPQNLRGQETIIQVGEALNHLSAVTEDMFEHINRRIEASREKLASISTRVDKVNTKIHRLAGAKKATQVFSSCKYPAADLNQPYVSIFSDVKPPELVRHKVKHKKPISNEEPLDKLNVYHVKIKKSDLKETISGLGEIPNDVTLVNDLLLYNSGKNLYKNFVMSDALDMSQHVRAQETVDSSKIGAAPLSISERSTITRSSTQYFYTPNLGEVPALDVPLDLPDLPNIADDLRYDTELGPGIAPSVITTPNIPDLPNIELETPVLESVPEIELPPPPPPPNVIIDEPKKIEKLQTPPAEVEPPKAQLLIEASPPIVSELPQLDMRASLMDAIRKAGGSKNLRASTKTNEDTKSKSVVSFF